MTSASAEQEGTAEHRSDHGAHLVTLVQLALLTWIVYLYSVEGMALLRVMMLAVPGFAVSVFLPRRHRLPFFTLLSLAGIVAVFGVTDGAWLVLCGLVLIALCHVPIAFGARVALILVAGAGLAALRTGVLDVPWSSLVWPILGSMFMFRLVLYLLAIKHGKTDGSVWGALAYFFMLPNVAFPLFPVVDYQTFRRTYFDGKESEVYERGVLWMTRGVVQLLLYRVVYHSVLNDPVEVATLGDLVQFMVGTFLLYLRVSGSFHLIVGLLHLFGFGLPETHKLYYLSNSFTDVWRRINIYWTDFMMKAVFYPAYFKVKQLGPARALMLATAAVFLSTWLLHSYQWFWLTGGFPLTLQDALFWTLLGALVVRGALRELKSVKKAPKGPAWDWHRGLQTVVTFALFCFLWSLWSTDSLIGWAFMLGAATEVDAKGLGLLALVLSIIFVLGGRDWSRRGAVAGLADQRVLAPRNRIFAALAVLLVIAQPGVRDVAPTTVAMGIDAMHRTGLNDTDAALEHRGYYEELDVRTRITDETDRFALRPPDWMTPAETGVIRDRADYLLRDLYPSRDVVWNGNSFSTNSWGMRDREYTLDKSPGTLRVALLGPSIVMGNGVGDGEAFEAVLEERLNRDFRLGGYDRFEILNFGVDGYSLTQQVAMLEERVFSFSPDVVVATDYSGNRTMTASVIETYAWEGVDVPPPLDSILASVGLDDVDTEGVPVPFGTVRAVAGWLGFDTRISSRETVARSRRIVDDVVEWSLRRFAEVSRSHDAVPVVLYLNSVVDDEPGAVPNSEIVEELDLPLIDLSGIFPEDERAALRVAPWDNHPNAMGHRLIAERMYDELSTLLRARSGVTDSP